MTKLDEEWFLMGQPENHNKSNVHRVFVATISKHWIGYECSCGYHWFRMQLRLQLPA